jgi:hypothetical protein
MDDESEREDEGRGQQPGADVGDDRDVPEDPLLAPPSADEPPELGDDEEDDEEEARPSPPTAS